MPLNLFFLISLSLATPLYAILHAASLMLPGYSICLMLAGILLWFSLRQHHKAWSDEIVLMILLMAGITLTIVGFAIAPLVIKLLLGTSLMLFYRRSASLALN